MKLFGPFLSSSLALWRAGGCYARISHLRGGLVSPNGRRFGRSKGHYVFMCSVPSFLQFAHVRVTRIRKSSHRRKTSGISQMPKWCAHDAHRTVSRRALRMVKQTSIRRALDAAALHRRPHRWPSRMGYRVCVWLWLVPVRTCTKSVTKRSFCPLDVVWDPSSRWTRDCLRWWHSVGVAEW